MEAGRLKFLTVLLVIAVMFTFSFGSAFADVSTGLSDAQQAVYDAAVGPSNAILNAKFETAWSKIATHNLTEGTAAYTVTPKAYAELKADALKAVTDSLYAAAQNGQNQAYLDNLLTADAIQTTIDTALIAKISQAQFAIDYATEVAKLATVDTSVYAKKADAEAKIAEVKAAAAAIANTIDSDSSMTACVLAWIDVNKLISDDLGTGAASLIKKVNYVVDGETIFAGVYELRDTATWKKVATSEADKAAEAAKKAALKAVVAQNVAEYQRDAGVSANATLIAAYTEGYGVVIDEKVVTDAAAIAPVSAFDPTSGAYRELVGNYGKIQELVAYAEKYKAEKDADGNLVRNAEAIDKIVAAAKKAAYSDATVAWAGLDAAKTQIAGTTIDSAAKGLAYAKENAKALAKDFVDDNYYYPAEQAKVDEILAEFNAKVDAATTTTEITKATTGLYAVYFAKLDAVKTKSEVNDDLDGKTAYTNAANALTTYVNYYNGTVDAGKKLDVAAIEDLLDEFYGENGARTEAAMKALKDNIIGLVDKLPTADAQAAAKKAAIDAINAIPATITLADEAAIQAAVNAVDAYEDLYGTQLPTASADALATAKAALGTAYKVDLYKKAAAVDKADKAAVKALIAEFDAADNNDCVTGMNLATNSVYDSLDKALTAIRTNEKNAVVKAINAIPVNVTEADKAQVEAARALYDTYVAEYTDYSCETWGEEASGLNCNAANDFTAIYRDLALAEAALGLNDPDPEENAKAYVQNLSIKARSVKTSKGVKITIKADVQQLLDDGFTVEYRFYRSTKSNKNFGKPMIVKSTNTYTNTKGVKGTRYYYKAKIVVKNAAGEVVATTPLTQCLYATRVF